MSEINLQKTVFRVQGLPNNVSDYNEVASLLSQGLGDTPSDNIQVFSLATTLEPWRNPPSKVATVMFSKLPSLLRKPESNWVILAKPNDGVSNIILDRHFMGMTPLNEVDAANHSFDCIAISGLSSHPLGSWQPRLDKQFMWIRDELWKDIPGTRTVIYGYDTRLPNSKSNQNVTNLAQAFIQQLRACGWCSRSGKPIAFLAHSLGGIVLREALVQLTSSKNEEFSPLLSRIKGAIFFGVPNLGMEQSHLRTLVLNNPNEALIEDLGRNSNYLRGLNESFSRNPFLGQLRWYRAFETAESPTTMGGSAILVSQESATYRCNDIKLTLPINSNHSEIVKFTRDSRDYLVMVRWLMDIYEMQQPGSHHQDNSFNKHPSAAGESEFVAVPTSSEALDALDSDTHQPSTRNDPRAGIELFKRKTGLTDAEEAEITATSYEMLQDFVRVLQEEQGRKESMMDMKRLERILIFVQQYGEVAEFANIFINTSETLSYLYGPMKYILNATAKFAEAFNPILDAYADLGDQVPTSLQHKQLFRSTPHMREVLVMVYKDILDFHSDTMRQLKQRYWKQLFKSSWLDFTRTIKHIKENLGRHRQLIQSPASIADFEGIQELRRRAINDFQKEMETQNEQRLDKVKQWLCAFNSEAVLESHKDTRSVCKDPGRWLLNNPQFEKWFSPNYCSTPLLWINGIPGAGKTILASVVIDRARLVPNTTVAFFFCKHGEEQRNSFISVARSILDQILHKNPHLLHYFHEKASTGGDAVLSSRSLAKEMVRTCLSSCEKTYLVIDGIDECGRDDRKEISTWFQSVTGELPADEVGSIRCLFVSQDDGVARKDLGSLPTIKITTENQVDLKDFANVWQEKIETKFGKVHSENFVANIICAKAQGMFIFAELLAKYLEDQLNRAALLEELKPAKLPVKLDNVYERILHRVLDSKTDSFKNQLQQVLGWIVCAKRPLRWREIQGAISIDLEQQHVDYDLKLLDSPKGLLASFIEVRSDETVELVHETAHEYLIRANFVLPHDVSYSLSMLSLAYLTFPHMDTKRSNNDIKNDLMEGAHAFYDYASACWSMHLQEGIPGSDSVQKLGPLQETLETFLNLHWVSSAKLLEVPKKVKESMSPFHSSEYNDKICQSIVWSRRQLGKYGQTPAGKEATDLWQVTENIRAVLENFHDAMPSEDSKKSLHQFYGRNWFKCPRVNCYYYHQGFSSLSQRRHHVNKHERPFLCVVHGCRGGAFGYVTEDELNKHLFDYHGIDRFDDREFLKPPKTQSTIKEGNADSATFQCPKCPSSFTRNHNLKGHLRTHEGTRPYACTVCSDSFTRKSDCDRHERGHGEKEYICLGNLKDQSTWGCKSRFGRADKLADHIRSRTGQKCIRPLVLEKLQENGGVLEGGVLLEGDNIMSDQLGPNAAALRAVGKLLPSFGEFLHLCGLDRSVMGMEAIPSSGGNSEG